MSESIERVGVVGAGLMGAGIAEVAPRPAPTSSSATSTRLRSRPGVRASRRHCRRPCVPGSSTTTPPWPRSGTSGSSPTSASSPTASSWSRRCSRSRTRSSRCSATLDKVVDRRGRHPGVEHVVDPDHEAGHGDRAGPSTWSGSTSSTRCRCCAWSSWSRRSLTSADAADRAEDFVADGARQAGDPLAGPGRLHRQRAARSRTCSSAIRMLESGFATADDIDAGMVEGCAHPMGPLRARRPDRPRHHRWRSPTRCTTEFKEPLYAPPPLLSRMVEAGLLGRKCGRGFFNYTK